MSINFTSWPYYWLGSSSKAEAENWVVFFGGDFKNIPEVSVKLFVEKTNRCLDYIRKNCTGYRLIYHPHPDETDESKFLDLTDFSVLKFEQITETFLLENKDKIKYLFSVCSTSSMAGLNMGFNAYSFFRYFSELFRGAHRVFIERYFSGLPDDFFIENLDSPLLENKRELKEDRELLESFRHILAENSGPVWFTVAENRLILAIVSLAKMIKKISPERKVNLIVSNHHRWPGNCLQELKKEFDEVLIYPRHFYSLRLRRLWAAFLTSRKIKNNPLPNGSVLVGFVQEEF